MRRLLQPCCWIFFLKITISVLHYVVCFPGEWQSKRGMEGWKRGWGAGKGKEGGRQGTPQMSPRVPPLSLSLLSPTRWMSPSLGFCTPVCSGVICGRRAVYGGWVQAVWDPKAGTRENALQDSHPPSFPSWTRSVSSRSQTPDPFLPGREETGFFLRDEAASFPRAPVWMG